MTSTCRILSAFLLTLRTPVLWQNWFVGHLSTNLHLLRIRAVVWVPLTVVLEAKSPVTVVRRPKGLLCLTCLVVLCYVSCDTRVCTRTLVTTNRIVRPSLTGWLNVLCLRVHCMSMLM